MPTINKNNGIEMADIAKINEQDVPSGGTGLTANALATTGVQLIGDAVNPYNSSVGAEFGRGPTDTTNSFTKIVCNEYVQFHALKSDGTLWYNYPSSAPGNTYYKPSAYIADGTWRQYGSDTNWTDITGGDNQFGAIKDGDYWFLGRGSYRMRGDGSTSSVSSWTEVNSSGDWSKIQFGYRATYLINTSGHLYACGYGYDYMLGQGNTSTISTLSREQFDLTTFADVKPGYRCAQFLMTNGDVYFTGNNANRFAGPQLTGSGDKNGPLLMVDSTSDYVCSKIGTMTYYGMCNIDTDGYLRFHGYAYNSYIRPDNAVSSSDNAQDASAGLRLDSLGTGWQDYFGWDLNGSTTRNCFAIKSGECRMGGNNAYELKLAAGLSVVNNSSWEVLRSANSTVGCIAYNDNSSGHFFIVG
tara:strand:- start:407 stop:1645 length:1239 start_codon:yes stop_codon:yes gene_type:complete